MAIHRQQRTGDRRVERFVQVRIEARQRQVLRIHAQVRLERLRHHVAAHVELAFAAEPRTDLYVDRFAEVGRCVLHHHVQRFDAYLHRARVGPVFKADGAVVQAQCLDGHRPRLLGRRAGFGWCRCSFGGLRRGIEQGQYGAAVLLAQHVQLQSVATHLVQRQRARRQIEILDVDAQLLGAQRGVVAGGRRQRQVGQRGDQRFRTHVECVGAKLQRDLAVGRQRTVLQLGRAGLAQIRLDGCELDRIQLQLQLAGALVQRGAALDVQRTAAGQLRAHVERGRAAERTHGYVAVEVVQHEIGRRLRGGIAPADAAVCQLQLADRHVQRLGLSRGRGGRRFGFDRSGFAAQPCKIDRAVRRACGIHAHAVQRQRIQVIHVVQRAHVGQRRAQLFCRHQGRLPGVGHFQVVEAGCAVHAQYRIAGLGLLEVDGQVRGQLALRYRHRQGARHVAEVARQIETIEFDVQAGFQRLRKRFGLAGEVQRRTVDPRGQQRLHEDVDVGRQARQEGHTDLQPVHRVLRPERLIDKLDGAVVQPQVGEEEARRLVRFGLGRDLRPGQPVDDIGEVEALFGRPHDTHTRGIHRQFFDDRRAAEDRTPRRVDMQMADVDERRRTVALGNVQLVDLEPQRVRVQSDLADRHRPFQVLAQLRFGQVMQQRWAAHPAQQAEHGQKDQHAEPDVPGAPRRPHLLAELSRALPARAAPQAAEPRAPAGCVGLQVGTRVGGGRHAGVGPATVWRASSGQSQPRLHSGAGGRKEARRPGAFRRVAMPAAAGSIRPRARSVHRLAIPRVAVHYHNSRNWQQW